MSNNKTPLIRTLRENGATMYVFPSASEDVGLNINNGTTGVALSNYALLNLTNGTGGNFNYPDKTDIKSDDIANDIQNYVMNFETVLLNQSTYNFQEPSTVSEHVFWHWMKKRFGFSISEVISNSNIYRETNYKQSDSHRLVQCFGSIDAGNSLSTDFGMFNETYVNIPTSYGNGPVFFRSSASNENYQKTTYKASSTLLEGRLATDIGYISNHTPITDDGTYNASVNPESIEIIKDIPTIQTALQKVSADSNISVSSYDDINIDQTGQFDSLSETVADSTGTKSTIYPYKMSEKCEFNFNAILLYYSIYDLNDVYKQPIATNLFGIVFLNGASNISGNYCITPFTKKKSSTGSSESKAYFGNSYSFRVNIKTLSVYDNTDANINDNTTTTSSYATDFNDVISNLNRAIDIMNTNVQTTSAIKRYYFENRTDFENMSSKIDNIESKLKNSISDSVTQAIKDLTTTINEKFTAIKEELNITDTTTLTSDGTALSAVRRYGRASRVYGTGTSSVESNQLSLSSGRTETIKVSKIIMNSASSIDLNSETVINMKAKDINFNLTDENNKTNYFSIISLIEKIAEIQKMLETFEKNVTELKNTENVEKENTESVSEIMFSAGIIPINGIILPRAKKPDNPGYYFKQNTAGNILNYAIFDGTDYVETVKCETGKIYSYDGYIYSFNGTTCLKFGESPSDEVPNS
jgi:hypothetical protein